MSLFKNTKRYRQITNEPLLFSKALLGKSLATPQRRTTAFAIDLIVFMILALLFVVFVTFVNLYISHPTLFSTIQDAIQEKDITEERTATLKRELFKLLAIEKPHLISKEFKKAVDEKNNVVLDTLLDPYSVNYSFAETNSDESYIDYETEKIHLTADIFFGEMSFLTKFGAIFIAYFTIFTWLTNGKTIGKWLLRIQVVKLSGEKLTFWNAFGRAGGYSASLSTLALGFLQAFWDPNRQTVHDKICSTVVVKNDKIEKG